MGASSWFWPVAIAPFVGSFLGVIATRVERAGSIVLGHSACPACGVRLGPRDLVPILSWLASRGRCRHCGQSIGAFYPAIELAALTVAVWAAVFTSGWILWASCVFGWALLVLAIIDFKYYLLPDFLTLPLIPAGLLAAYVLDPSSLIDNIIGAAVGFSFVIILRWLYQILRGREGMGLGDAKLLAAAGAWVSWTGLPSVVLLAALIGLMIALLRHWRGGKLALTDRVPFGTYLCFGAWIVWLYGPLQTGGNGMRLGLVGVVGAALVFPAQMALAGDAPPDQAQTGSGSTDQPPKDSAPSNQPSPCVDVQIGGDRSAYLDCLNDQMKRNAEHEQHRPQPTAPIDAQSPSNQVGTANDAAARERMGNAFGKSAVPQRPPKPNFVNPVIPGSH